MNGTQVAESQSNLLLEAFSSFTEASASLERAYCELLEKVEFLSGQLEQSHYYLNTVLQSLPCGVLVINENKDVTALNRTALELFGLEHCQVPFPLSRLLRDASFSERASSLEQAVADFTEISLSGSGRTLQCLWSRMRNNERILVVQDVTGVRLLESRIQKAEKIAAQGEMALEVAHEIRNPLGAMELFASLLAEEGVSEQEGRLYLTNLRIGIQSLNTVLTNMLCFARHPEPSKRDVMVGDLIKSTLGFLQPLMDQRKIHLELECRDNIPASLDPDMLRQILNNLVTNALQALPQGGRLRVQSDSDDGSVSLIVRDDGSGIPEVEVGRIFDSGFTTSEKGHGLGLAIVKRFVEAQGGSIKVESGENWGTQFLLTFPVGEGGS